MSVKPILFKPEMVRAILEGRKTMTRRVLKMPPPTPMPVQVPLPYARGDLLWVREMWAPHSWDEDGAFWVKYAADGAVSPDLSDLAGSDEVDKWVERVWLEILDSGAHVDGQIAENATIACRPSIHMPRWASRITLEVTDVRVQRIQEISEDDAASEGVILGPPSARPNWGWIGAEGMPDRFYASEAFRDLWDSINAKHGYGWEANPWVAAYSFKTHLMNIDAFLREGQP